MNVVLVGAGVVGSVYGAELAGAGHQVATLAHEGHSGHDGQIEIVTHDTVADRTLREQVSIVADLASPAWDMILVTVRAEQLATVVPLLRQVAGHATILFFGNNPEGRSAIPSDLGSSVALGFPGVGGFLHDGVVHYQHISQQRTTLQAGGGRALEEFEQSLRGRGFPTSRVADMDGWLAYHAVFVACVAAALYRCDTSPARLANDRDTLKLMCRAIEEGFAALSRRGVGGAAGSLRLLHHPVLRPVAVRYWARMLRSPMGEACFAAHARHAQGEMHWLMRSVVALAEGPAPSVGNLRELVGAGPMGPVSAAR